MVHLTHKEVMMLPSLKRLTDLFKTDILVSKLRRILVQTTIAGLGVVPGAQAASISTSAPVPVSTPIIVNRGRRTGTARLAFQALSQNAPTLFASNFTHTSHASHASHSSGTTGTTPAPAAKAADSQSIQKLALTVTSVNKLEKYVLAKDEFEAEFKIYYSSETKVTTLGSTGVTRTISAILTSNAKDEIFKKGQDLSVIWEAQGSKRVALKVTILE